MGLVLHRTTFGNDAGWSFDVVVGGRSQQWGGQRDEWTLALYTQRSPQLWLKESATRPISTAEGVRCIVRVVVRVCPDSAREPARPLLLEVANPTGAPYSVLASVAATPVWTEVLTEWDAAGDVCILRIRPEPADTPGEALSAWLVDCVEVCSMGARSIRDVWLAISQRLTTLSTADGYYHDAPLILPRLIAPTEAGAPRAPYICLPLEDSAGYETLDSGGLVVYYEQPIYVMLADARGGSFAESSAADGADWHDDIVRAFMSANQWEAWDIGRADLVDDFSVVSKSLQSEPIELFPPHVRIVVRAALRVTRADLGPA